MYGSSGSMMFCAIRIGQLGAQLSESTKSWWNAPGTQSVVHSCRSSDHLMTRTINPLAGFLRIVS